MNGQTAGSAQSPKLPAIVGKLNIILHVSVALISLSIAFLLFDSSLFSWHPMFMSLGYILFMTEGLMSAVMFRHLDGPERVRAIQAHALMQVRAVLCILIGFAVIYQNKVRNNKSHFHTTHAKFGLATLILTVASPLMGVISFKRLGLIYYFPETWHTPLKWVHRKAGLLTWLLALITIELALTHPAVKKPFLTPVWQVGVAFIGATVLMLLSKAQVKLKDDRHFDNVLAKAV